jgi:hypothetical protein
MAAIHSKSAERSSLNLRVVIFEDSPGTWVAQVLERDMAAHGKSPYAALAAVQLVLQAHVNFDTRQQRVPLSRLKPAPDEYWHAYQNARPLPNPPKSTMLSPAQLTAAIAAQPILRHA